MDNPRAVLPCEPEIRAMDLRLYVLPKKKKRKKIHDDQKTHNVIHDAVIKRPNGAIIYSTGVLVAKYWLHELKACDDASLL